MTEEEADALREAVRLMHNRVQELEAALKPFGDAFKLHAAYINQPRKFKERIAFSLGLLDWNRVASTLKIEPTPTENISQTTEE